MNEINLCIPVLKRYDLLEKCISSALKGNLPPSAIFIIDNGGKYNQPKRENIFIMKPPFNLGVAASWNLFLTKTHEYRIICNDDVEFYPETIEFLIKNFDPNLITYPGGLPSAGSFSCFLIPDKVIEHVGLFDPSISPGYAYYEDNDYHWRMKQKGFDIKGIENCRLGHQKSSTLAHYKYDELQNHHRRFRLATSNYFQKWGGKPGEEKFTEAFDGNS